MNRPGRGILAGERSESGRDAGGSQEGAGRSVAQYASNVGGGGFMNWGCLHWEPMSDALVINEIYLSLQGESTFAGLP